MTHVESGRRRHADNEVRATQASNYTYQIDSNMFLTVEEAESLVAHRRERLERAEGMERPGYLAKCRENLDAAIWRLRHAETRTQA